MSPKRSMRGRRGNSSRKMMGKAGGMRALTTISFSSITTTVANTEVINEYAIPAMVNSDLVGRDVILDSVNVQYISASATALVGAIGQVRLTGAPVTTSGANSDFASQAAKALSNVNTVTCTVTTLRAMKTPFAVSGSSAPMLLVSLISVVPAVFQLRIRVNVRVTVDTSYTAATPILVRELALPSGRCPEDAVQALNQVTEFR